MGEFSVGHLFLMANGYLKSERGYRKLEISLSGNANISGVNRNDETELWSGVPRKGLLPAWRVCERC
jgi:hypothetical protein